MALRHAIKEAATVTALTLVLVTLTACQPVDVVVEKPPRLVRVVPVAIRDHVETVSLTGEVQARTRIDLAFRVTGQINELNVATGDHVMANQVLARIDAEMQRADLEVAEASLQAAEATLEQSGAALARQKLLLVEGLVTRSKYDQAEQDHQTALSALESARAMYQVAMNALSYTELRADSAGIVTRVSREPGEIAPAALPVISLAHDGPRDAVFNVPEPLLFANTDALLAANVDVGLLADESVATTGAIREVSPTVDSRSGTVRLLVALQDTPSTMTLGALVIGRVTTPAVPAIVVPWSAITLDHGRPAVWLVDPEASTTTIRPVEIEKYTTSGIVLAGGLQVGELLVTEGGQFLYDGKPVHMVGGDPS